MSAETTRIYVFPDKMRIDATIVPRRGPRTLVSVGLSDESGWRRQPDSNTREYVVRDATGSELQTLKFERWSQPEQILLTAFDPMQNPNWLLMR